MSQYLKNPNVATVASKTQSTDPEPRSLDRTGRQCGNDSTDDTTADNTGSSVQCDIPNHSAKSPEAPQMTNSLPAVAPQNPTTPPLSAIPTHPPNSPAVHSDSSNPATPKPIPAAGCRHPAVPDANHPGTTSDDRGEWPRPIQSNEIDST